MKVVFFTNFSPHQPPKKFGENPHYLYGKPRSANTGFLALKMNYLVVRLLVVSLCRIRKEVKKNGHHRTLTTDLSHTSRVEYPYTISTTR